MLIQVRNVIMNEPIFFLESVGAQLIINGATRPNVQNVGNDARTKLIQPNSRWPIIKIKCIHN